MIKFDFIQEESIKLISILKKNTSFQQLRENLSILSLMFK